MTQLHYDGRPVTIHLTRLERRLAATILEGSEAGPGEFSLTNREVAMTEPDPDREVWTGGYERVRSVHWPDRRQLGGLLVSLQRKNVIILEDGNDGTGLGEGIWFDIDTMRTLTRSHADDDTATE